MKILLPLFPGTPFSLFPFPLGRGTYENEKGMYQNKRGTYENKRGAYENKG